MGSEPLFDFEQDFAKAFQCIPMVVRYRLDLCGIKLSLRQWKTFTDRDRRDLLQAECASAPEIAQFRAVLTALISSRAGETAVTLPVEERPAWADLDAVPDQIIAYAGTQGIAAPSLAEWRSISVLQRFTLLKLSRASHDNVHFLPALKEFNLLPA